MQGAERRSNPVCVHIVAVITGLVPEIHVLFYFLKTKTWMAGLSPAMMN